MNQPSRPFSYSLRVSARARHVRLAIKPYLGLEVVIPKRFPKKQIPRILQQHEAWIAKQLEKHRGSLQGITLPDSIHIAFIDVTVSIQYEKSSRARVIEQGPLLIIKYSSDKQAIKLLRNWIRNKAKQLLIPELERVAHETGFKFNKTSIRSQKSRWGSCSSSGTISLNDQLLFMQPETVRYLMIHELCHTRQMNHSKAFWRLVESCCADFRLHENKLSSGRECVPAWFSRSLFC